MSSMKHDVWRYNPGTVTTAARRVTEALVEACALRSSDRVLDLACGGGNPSVHIASSVTTAGLVVAADIDMRSLAALAGIARAEKIENLLPLRCGSNHLPFAADCFDAATCRFGVMFFDDLSGTLAELHRVLRRGAKLAFAVYGPKRSNSLYTEVEAALAELGVSASRCSQRIFRFSDDRILEEALVGAGFDGGRATDLTGSWDQSGHVQILHLLQRTYQPAIAALGDEAGLAFAADMQRQLMRKRDAGELAWHFRIIGAERR
jgi:ubiquinone/menaquinone biosynthesis C-methylase UbiE